MSGHGAGSKPDRRAVAVALAAAAIAFVLHLSSVDNGFVNWDDGDYLTRNPHFGRFDPAFIRWSFSTWWYANWHPLTWLSYGLDHAIWGMDPAGFHLTNVLFHAANSFLVALLAARLFARVGVGADARLCGAAFVGAIFAAHPLHVESVAWVSERKDVLYAFFSLLATLAYLTYADSEPGSRARRRAYAGTVAGFAFAVMSKPMAVTLPIVFLILDAYPLGRLGEAAERVRIVLVEKWPLYAISLGSAAVTIAAQRAGGAMELADLSLGERLVVAETALGFYLAKFALPIGLVPLYPLPVEISPWRWQAVASFFTVAAVTAGAVVFRRRAPVIAAAWAYFLVTLLPVIGIVKVGEHAAADRYMYLPMLGPAFVTGALAAAVYDARPSLRRAIAAVALCITVLLGIRSHFQIDVWKDSFTLWEYVAWAQPDSVTAHYNLGYSHYLAGNAPAAEAEYKRALEISPTHVSALNELGALYAERGSFGLAARYFAAAVEVDPEVAHYHLNLGFAYEKAGNWADAQHHYRRYLELAPPGDADKIARIRAKLSGR